MCGGAVRLSAMAPLPPLPPWNAGWALFLDVDGTLLEIEEHPDDVRARPRLKVLVEHALHALGGALALVSGRSIASLDRVFAPLVLPAAGLHGLERRGADGRVHYPSGFAERLGAARCRLMHFVQSQKGLLLEDKGAALALHFRAAPELAEAARRAIESARAELGDDFHVQQGKMVLELKPGGEDKGTAVAAFMLEAPFAGRLPVFVGDDVTDEDGFRAVNGMGGISVRVGRLPQGQATTAAQHCAASVEAVLDWLESCLEDGDAKAV